MRFNYDSREHRIQFGYSRETRRKRVYRNIWCRILKKPATDEKKPWFPATRIGWARCSPKDHFVKETGRKIALTRALEGCPLFFRSSAWAAYRERRPV